MDHALEAKRELPSSPGAKPRAELLEMLQQLPEKSFGQGNSNFEVQIYRYVTERSFDAFSWQVLESKARFIAQVMSGESDLRRIEDIDGAALGRKLARSFSACVNTGRCPL